VTLCNTAALTSRGLTRVAGTVCAELGTKAEAGSAAKARHSANDGAFIVTRLSYARAKDRQFVGCVF
jgi:hypothetical protein